MDIFDGDEWDYIINNTKLIKQRKDNQYPWYTDRYDEWDIFYNLFPNISQCILSNNDIWYK